MKLLSYDDLKPVKGIGYSKTQLWRLERQRKFPRRVPLGGARYGYVDIEIDDYIRGRIAERDRNEEAA